MKIKIDAILLDLDGTLVDSRQDITNSANIVRSRFGLSELSMETVSGYVGDGLPTLVKRLLPDHDEQTIKDGIAIFRDHYVRHCTDYTRPYPGVIETLEYFHRKHKVVITNKMYDISMEVLQRLDMARHFCFILGGDSTPLTKPHPMPLLKSLELVRVDAKHAIMIGDSGTDIEAGKKADVWTCAATYGLKAKSTLEIRHPDFMIDRFDQLRDLIE